MKKLAFLAALACGLATQASAGGNSTTYQYQDSGYVIVVSCFRGPWKEVIWDRPNAKFVDSLVDVGYDYPSAHAISERICRDDTLVGNKEGLRAEMIRVFEERPRYRNQNIRIRKH